MTSCRATAAPVLYSRRRRPVRAPADSIAAATSIRHPFDGQRAINVRGVPVALQLEADDLSVLGKARAAAVRTTCRWLRRRRAAAPAADPCRGSRNPHLETVDIDIAGLCGAFFHSDAFRIMGVVVGPLVAVSKLLDARPN
mgnify:CR=1 FL=1